MLDKDGMLKFLGLNKKTKIKGATGLEQIKYLFNLKDRVYQKGYAVDGMVKALDVGLICEKLGNELYLLYDELGGCWEIK